MAHDLIELAARVGETLKTHGLMLATAESCTGGGVAQAITEIPGSSAWFDRGFVTYSNASKMALLDIPASALEAHGAVSRETAAAMSTGALRHSDAQVALSTTGIAGPDGGTPDKPVGTVCFGWVLGEKLMTERVQFSGDRHAVRTQSIEHALRGLLVFLDQPLEPAISRDND
jgi:nicotinamide-nucleotide amidase